MIVWGKKKLEISVNVAQCTNDGSSSSERLSLLSLTNAQTKSQRIIQKSLTACAVWDVLKGKINTSPEKTLLTMFRHNLPDVTSK